MAQREVLITIPPPHLAGYSVAVLHKARGLSFVAGAPRHKERGAVFELQKVGRETNNFMPVLEGEQVPVRKGTRPLSPTIIIDGDPETPEGKEWAPGHTEGGGPCLNRTQPWPRLCVPECQLVFPIVGDPVVHPASYVILENILTWSDPNRMVQEEHEQGSSLAEGAGGGGGSGGGGSLALPVSCNSPGL